MNDEHSHRRRIPVAVGVTGHRDLLPEHEKMLREVVRRELEALRQKYPHSPFVILSSLAEGSDQLVAEVGLELGCDLIAPLPLPVGMYEKDFSPAGLENFRELLGKSTAVVEMPFLPGANESNTVEGALRDKQYALCGAYVVRHTSVLFALWDGERAAGTGGTAEIVEFRLEGVPSWLEESWQPFESKDAGLAIVVRTPRARHRSLLGDAFSVRRLAGPRPSSEAELGAELQALDELNGGVLSADEPLEDGAASGELQALGDRFRRADLLAVSAQTKAQDALVKILGLGFFFPILFSQLGYAPSAFLFFLCILAIGIAYTLHFREIHLHRWQAKHLEYRAVAEALRVQLYWAMSGIASRVSPFFLYAYENEGAWIRTATRFAAAGLPAVGRDPTQEDAEKLARDWIGNQRQYFEGAFRRQLNKNMVLSSLKFALLLFAGLFKFLPDILTWLATDPARRAQWFVFAQVVALGLIIGVHTWSRVKELRAQRKALSLLAKNDAGFWSRPSGLISMLLLAIASAETVIFELYRRGFADVEPLAHLCSLIALAAASAAAIIHIYSHVQAFTDNARRYGRLMALFARGEKLFSTALTAGDFPMLRMLIFSLGKEALTEAGEWLRLQRSRPIEVPRI